MGGGAMPEGGGKKGKKRNLDAIINVVPAIDLLSCCISFLLFTAVWTQISRLQVQQMGTASEAPPPEQKTLTVTLSLTERGFVLATSSGTSTEIPNMGRNPDGTPIYDIKKLTDRLKQIKSDYPDQVAITVAAEDSVIYADLVQVIDVCNGAGLTNVAVTAAG
jgi:biopolymer transport protein ExbD